MIICVRPNVNLPFKENISIFKKLGYKHTRFDLEVIPDDDKRPRMDVFKDYYDFVKKAGMDFVEFHSFAAMDIDSFKRKAALELEMMKLCGAKVISQHLTDELMKYPDAINAVIKRFKDAGISFCVENLLRDMCFASIEEADAILSKLPDADIAFDIGHAVLTGLDLCEFYDKYKEKIKVIHLHDVIETDHLVPFTGMLRKSPFVSRLKEFKGVVVLEIRCHSLAEVEKNFKEAQQNIKKFL
ncbi:sugar phosphate isomerase/epimerase [Candidatus Woesearchaeota archaeon]|nr:sugar phosphate isomerase/epimerase [Candidatus Woesearchaeota archaeon]